VPSIYLWPAAYARVVRVELEIMMRMYYLYLIKFFVIMLLLNSCSNSNEPDDIIVHFCGVTKIVKIDSSSPLVTFDIKAGWGNSCGRFHHADVVISDRSYYVKVYGFQKREAICATVNIQYDATIMIDVHDFGEYTFKFLESDSATIDTTVIIE
jgi:hypothetical protein